MNRQEFEDTARRYREELFRMYASQNITPQPKPEAVPAAAPLPQTQAPPAPPVPAISEAPVQEAPAPDSPAP